MIRCLIPTSRVGQSLDMEFQIAAGRAVPLEGNKAPDVNPLGTNLSDIDKKLDLYLMEKGIERKCTGCDWPIACL